MQPDDVQRIIAHVAFVRCGRRHTFVFRPRFAFTLPLWTLWAAHFPFFPQLGESIPISSFFRHYVQGEKRTLKDISGEKESADARIDERAKSLTVRRNRRLLLNQEEKERAMRPVLPWHVPFHGRCAQAQYPSDPS